jgi:uncharacterized membrane protein YphA (DoxX/SURF4 family)
MDLLTGALQILAVVVVVGGAAKLVMPAAFSETLRSLGVPGGAPLARLAGLVEIGLGAAALIVGGRAWAAALAALYAVFTVVVVLARRRGAESCGCFGSVAAPPSTLHVVIDAASAAVALAAAIVGVPGLTDVLADQPLAGVPYLALIAIGAWLLVVADTTGAQLLDEMAAVRRLGPTFRDNARGAGAPARTLARPNPTRQD